MQSVVDAGHRLNPPRPQRASNESFLELRSALEGSGQNRKVVLAMCAYAHAIGRTFVEPCVRNGRIEPCETSGAMPLSAWYDLLALRKVCNIVDASHVATALARIPFGVTRRNVRVGWFGAWTAGAPGTTLEDPAAALLTFEIVARSEVYDADRLGLWTTIRRHHPAGHDLWHVRGALCATDPHCLDSYFPVKHGLSRALLATFRSRHNLSDAAYDVFHWRSEQGPGTILASNRSRALQQFAACAHALVMAVKEHAKLAGRPIVLVSDIPFGNATLSPSYAYADRLHFLRRARTLLQPHVLKLDTTPGSWGGDALWHADMHLFSHAAESFQCVATNSSVCRTSSQSAESASSAWLAAQRHRAGRATHSSWLDGLDKMRVERLEMEFSKLEGVGKAG